jgi:8-oxo-dGTP pyrophosphatase MutT (NUDIX family)
MFEQYPWQSSKCIVINRFGEWLYGIRRDDDNKSRDNTLDLPGGGLHVIDTELGVFEDPIHGGIRETAEEFGLALDPENVSFLMATSVRSVRFKHSKLVHFLIATIDDCYPELNLDHNEVVSAGWGRPEYVGPQLGREDMRIAAKFAMQHSGVLVGV